MLSNCNNLNHKKVNKNMYFLKRMVFDNAKFTTNGPKTGFDTY